MADHPDPRPYGRRAFLGVVAAGLSSLFWAEPAWRRARGVLATATSILPSELAAIVPSQGWRIYGCRHDAHVRPRQLAPPDRRARRASFDALVRGAARPSARRASLD